MLSAVERMAVWNSEEDLKNDLAERPSIYTNGQEVGKTPQRKNTHAISEIFWFRFLPSDRGQNTWRIQKRNLGGSDPVSTFGRQNRTNTGVAPAQIKVFVRGLFSGEILLSHSLLEFCFEGWVNATPMFSGEHCECSCVHPFCNYFTDCEASATLSQEMFPCR